MTNQQNEQPVIKQANELVNETGRPLLRAKTVFPFTFFPTRIEVNEKVVNLVYQPFFFSKDTYPILITDIKNLQAATNPFFGSLKIEVAGYEQNPPKISFLPRPQAIKIRRLIMGLKVLNEEGVDVTALEKEVLIKKAIQLGRAHTIAER